MHFDVYKLIWFKDGLMIDTTDLYISIVVLVTLTLIQGHCNERKQKLLQRLFFKVLMDVDGI